MSHYTGTNIDELITRFTTLQAKKKEREIEREQEETKIK